ncbi:arf-GAP with SH3 domain, ANK repeat and PH domain-containing protein 1-like [Callospermophilus lateralis]
MWVRHLQVRQRTSLRGCLNNPVALRKTETSHHLSLDKANIPPEIFQKSSQLAELPQKPPPGDLPPKPTELAPKPQVGDLPPKPGELPPKPQLSDLSPKPHMKDLPPKPQLGDLLAKSQMSDVSPKSQQPSEVTQKSHPGDLSLNMQSRDTVPKQASEDSSDLTPTLPETPVPLPRKINTVGAPCAQATHPTAPGGHRDGFAPCSRLPTTPLPGCGAVSVLKGKNKVRPVKTIYDCQADNYNELTFIEGEVIIVTGEEDQEWWADQKVSPQDDYQAKVQQTIGHIKGQPERKGVFPVSFVHILSD